MESDQKISMADPTNYEVLSLTQSASAQQIRASYLALARDGHPDLLDKDSPEWNAANERLTRINEAYNVLKDSGRRAKYDASLSRKPPTSGASKSTASYQNAGSNSPLNREEQKLAAKNKDRYRRALESNEMIAFAGAIGLELYRQQAVRELQDDRVQTAKLLIQRFLTATR